MEKELQIKGRTIKLNDIVNTSEGRAKLDYIGKSFTNWTLIDDKSISFFGRPITVEDNNLYNFII